MKKAIVVVRLVHESKDVSDSQIVKEIVAEAKIPWTKNMERITIDRKF